MFQKKIGERTRERRLKQVAAMTDILDPMAVIEMDEERD